MIHWENEIGFVDALEHQEVIGTQLLCKFSTKAYARLFAMYLKPKKEIWFKDQKITEEEFVKLLESIELK